MKLRSNNQSQLAAFTLVEVVVAFVLIGIAATTAYYSFEMINTQSVTARLFTNATAIAQNSVELFQTDGPFNPQADEIPEILALGVQQDNDVVIYTDPSNDNIVVTGSVKTEVTDAGFTTGSPAVNLNVRQLKVTLNYTYRGRSFTVIMDTMRSSDI